MPDVVNLPPLPGLPDVELAPGAPAIVPLLADDPSVLAALGSAPWGIYSGGAPVIVADTCLDVAYSKAFQISDFPVEQGGFQSFDSVEQPFEGRIRLASGGSSIARSALISSVEAIVGDLNTYDVVTPDRVYINANVVREEYRRDQADAGNSLLVMEVAVQEVRMVQGNGMPSTADPASADQVSGNVVQPQNVDPSIFGPVTTPLPQTLSGVGGIGGLPAAVPNPLSGGIGTA